MKRTWMVAAALGLAAFGVAQDANKVIATVNGEQILGGEYYHRMEFLPGVSMKFGGQVVESTPGFFTITQLIGEKLVYQLAKQKGILPTQGEIDNELALRTSVNPHYIQDEADQGITEADLRNSIKYDLAKFKLQTEGITVTDQEVQDYYNKHPKEFTAPKRVHVKLLAVRSLADEKAADTALKVQQFGDVAKSTSIDVTAGQGGDLGMVPITYFTADAQTALSSTKIGSTTPWITMYTLDENGKPTSAVRAFVKYQLLDVQPEALQPLDKATSISIRRALMVQRGQQKIDVAKEIDDMRSKAKVTFTTKQYQDLWDQMTGSGS